MCNSDGFLFVCLEVAFFFFSQVWHPLHSVTAISSIPAGANAIIYFHTVAVSWSSGEVMGLRLGHSLPPALVLHSCFWTTLFRQKKFLLGIHRTVAILLFCTGSAMQDFVLSAFVFTVLWLLAESLDNDNLSQGPEKPWIKGLPLPHWHPVNKILKCAWS